jgi:hypothetical protein
MVEKPAISEPPPRRRVRPSRQERTAKAMATLTIDPQTVNPLGVLAAIMVDTSLPAVARVQAAKALIAARDQDPAENSGRAQLS